MSTHYKKHAHQLSYIHTKYRFDTCIHKRQFTQSEVHFHSKHHIRSEYFLKFDKILQYPTLLSSVWALVDARGGSISHIIPISCLCVSVCWN